MTVWFATVTVPLRAPPVFAAAVIVTVPSPRPVAPEVIESHDVLLLAVHGHPFAVMIEIGLAAPPPASTFNEVGLTLY